MSAKRKRQTLRLARHCRLTYVHAPRQSFLSYIGMAVAALMMTPLPADIYRISWLITPKLALTSSSIAISPARDNCPRAEQQARDLCTSLLIPQQGFHSIIASLQRLYSRHKLIAAIIIRSELVKACRCGA